MKLFPKLALSVSLLLALTLLGLTLSFYWTERLRMQEEASQDRQALVTHLTHIAQESFLTNDDLLLVKYTRWISRWNPSMRSASVWDTTGEVLAHSDPFQIGKATAAPLDSASKMLVLSQPVRLGGRLLGTVSIVFSEQALDRELQARTRDLRRRLSQVSGAALVAGLLVCLGLSSSWTRPLHQLTRLAGDVGRGRWTPDIGSLARRRDELGVLSRAFEDMARKLGQLDEMKEDFVSAVTHELRSPLGAIESYLNLIAQELREGISATAWENYLERLRVNTSRLSRFVNDLLDVAALERGKIKLKLQPVDLVNMAQDVLGLFALKLEGKGLSYEVQGPSEPCPALADPDKIRHVLVNLVSNAIKFTPAGGRVWIEISHPRNAGMLRVEVADTGCGIAADDQLTIFSKFEQVRSAQRNVEGPKGTGLGLAICKALVELHGNTLKLESQPEKGSVFFFELPLAQGDRS